MNVDKFGHHVHKRLRMSELFDFDIILKKTETGDIDLKSNHLRGLPLPESGDHAVNKEYVDNLIDKLNKTIESNKGVKLENGILNLESSIIKDIRSPLEPNDAVNKHYVDENLKKYCTQEQLLKEKSTIRKNTATLMSNYLKEYYTKSEIDSLIQSLTNHE